MLALFCGIAWGLVVLYLLSRVLRQFRAHRLASLNDISPRVLPPISVIVPVRNEIANIGACLAGLEEQTGLDEGSSILIVDDDSQDGTRAVVEREIARGAPVALAAAGRLPAGWMGKPHACWRGAALSSGEWLCFIDADVRVTAKLVATAVAAAEAQQIDMLSLQPFQELGSFWERLVFPAGLLMIACAKDPTADADWASSESAANGQFILIRRRVYMAVGGHAAVRGEVCEDKALAARVKAAGYRFRALRAEHLAQTRMYRDFNSLWEGLSKNATAILGSPGATLLAGVAAFAVGWGAVLLPLALGLVTLRAPSAASEIGLAAALFGSGVVIGIQLGTARYLRIPFGFGLLLALGYSVAGALACHSVLVHLSGRVTWKGRTYHLHRKASPGHS